MGTTAQPQSEPPVKPTGKPPTELLFGDPLAEVTRKERKSLLVVSAVAIVIAKTGLVPSKISALGIEFTQADKTALLRVLAAVVAYFVVAFLVYASSDFVWWRISIQAAQTEWWDWYRYTYNHKRQEGASGTFRLTRTFLYGPSAVLRPIFDFVVPLAIAGYAIHALLNVK
jgi:hypothetical protein